MTPKEFTERMKAIGAASDGDLEKDHILADELLCECLISLGYEEGVAVFDDLDKWYA